MTLHDGGADPPASDRADPASADDAASDRPTLPDISFSTFASVDLRVGRVVAVEENARARKPAWKIGVDFGPLGTRWTSAQVRQYRREELIGSLVVGAVNLGVKRIAGFRSEFLLLGAEDGDGVIHLLRPDTGASPGDGVC
jgi:tRNA-binding protein